MKYLTATSEISRGHDGRRDGVWMYRSTPDEPDGSKEFKIANQIRIFGARIEAKVDLQPRGYPRL